jgi:isopentenyldiphosphate isomerase
VSKDEIIDVLDEDGKVIDTISRAVAEDNNDITENVLIFVFNSEGKVWAQLRSKTKRHFPSMWDISACGGVVSGESHAESARRETLEETGLDVELHFVETFMNVFPGDKGETRRRLSNMYVGISDGQPVINDEVDEFKAWLPGDLKNDIVRHPEKYVPSFTAELDMALAGREKLL